MHSQTLELLQHLDATRAQLHAAFHAVPAALHATRPSPDRWSVADVLSHLAMIETSVAEILQRKLRRALADAPLPAAAEEPPTWPRLGGLLLDPGLRVKAPEFVVPDGTRSAADAWRSLQASRLQMWQLLLAGDGLSTAGITARHVLLGTLTFHEWFGFVGYHEQRHAVQITNVHAELTRC